MTDVIIPWWERISTPNCLKCKDNHAVSGNRPRGEADHLSHSRNAISGLRASPKNTKPKNTFTVSTHVFKFRPYNLLSTMCEKCVDTSVVFRVDLTEGCVRIFSNYGNNFVMEANE